MPKLLQGDSISGSSHNCSRNNDDSKKNLINQHELVEIKSRKTHSPTEKACWRLRAWMESHIKMAHPNSPHRDKLRLSRTTEVAIHAHGAPPTVNNSALLWCGAVRTRLSQHLQLKSHRGMNSDSNYPNQEMAWSVFDEGSMHRQGRSLAFS